MNDIGFYLGYDGSEFDLGMTPGLMYISLTSSPADSWLRLVAIPLAPLYSLSLLHTLVARKSLRDLVNSNLSAKGVRRINVSSSMQESRDFKSLASVSHSEPVVIVIDHESTTRVDQGPTPRKSVNRALVPDLEEEPIWDGPSSSSPATGPTRTLSTKSGSSDVEMQRLEESTH